MSSVQTIVKGSCNCGAVQYKITGKHLMAVNCHCQDCREAHGSPYTHVIVYDYEQVQWTKGEENLNRYDRRGANRRTFCKVCGTPMCSDLYKGKKFAFFAPSAREGKFPAPTGHIFTNEACSYQSMPGDKLPIMS